MAIKQDIQEVLVVGYPKSGNTWLTRLVAELIACPVKGFFEQPNNPEISIEGGDRQSSYVVFKGHQTFHQVCKKIQHKHLIYVVRDVRDIAISGANFFRFHPDSLIDKFICKLPKIGDFYYKQTFIAERAKISKMIHVLDKGNRAVSWCHIPWDEHVTEYLSNEVLFIKYENLLINPHLECQKILSHIGIHRSEEQIDTAIKKQSFKAVKEKSKSSNDKRQKNILRQGISGVWEEKLTIKQKYFLTNRFFDTLNSLGYLDPKSWCG